MAENRYKSYPRLSVGYKIGWHANTTPHYIFSNLRLVSKIGFTDPSSVDKYLYRPTRWIGVTGAGKSFTGRPSFTDPTTKFYRPSVGRYMYTITDLPSVPTNSITNPPYVPTNSINDPLLAPTNSISDSLSVSNDSNYRPTINRYHLFSNIYIII